MTPKLLGRSTTLWVATMNAVITFVVYVGWLPLDGPAVGLLLSLLNSLIALLVGQALTPNGEVAEVIEAGKNAIEAKNDELVAVRAACAVPPSQPPVRAPEGSAPQPKERGG